jgi:hypothetical protein
MIILYDGRTSQRKLTARSTRIAEAEARGSTSFGFTFHILPFLAFLWHTMPRITVPIGRRL